LFVNGVYRGQVTPEQQAQMNQYRIELARWSENFGRTIQQQVQSELNYALRYGTAATYAPQSNAPAGLPQEPAFCRVA
uniref:Pepsin-I3 domain-containing protein n=1 Tax=Anisakis simplex TaxID=6269 RepID=A0A0M3KC00_ANISI